MPEAEQLSKLLNSRYEWEHAEIELKPEREKVYLELFEAAYREALTVKPSLSRRLFLSALDLRYKTYRSDRRKSEMGSIPPSARGN